MHVALDSLFIPQEGLEAGDQVAVTEPLGNVGVVFAGNKYSQWLASISWGRKSARNFCKSHTARLHRQAQLTADMAYKNGNV